MATNKEYLDLGYSQAQINQAVADRENGKPMGSPTPANLPVPETNTVTAPVENTTVASPTVSTPETPVTPTPVETPVTPTEGEVRKGVPTDYVWDAKSGKYLPSSAPTSKVSETTQTPSKTQENVPKTDVSGKVETPQVNWDSSVGREGEISTNVNRITQESPTLLSSREEYDKAFGYATADAGKKAILDSFFKKSAEQKEIQSIVDKYSAYTTDDFATGLVNGTLTPKTLSVLRSNPALAQKIERAETLNRIAGNKVDTAKVGNESTQEVLASALTVKKALEDGEITPEELVSLTTNEETKKLEESLKVKGKKKDELSLAYENIEADIRKRYGGSLTESETSRMVANAQKEIRPALNLAIKEYEREYGFYTDKKKELLSSFNTNLELSEARRKETAAIEAEKAKQAFEEKKINDKNVYDSVNAEIKFAMENGIDLKRTNASVVIADAKKYAEENGVSFETALNETFTKPLTAKPSYARAIQAVYDKNSGALTPFQRAQLSLSAEDNALARAKFAYDVNKPEWKEDADGNWINVNSPDYKPGITADVNGTPFDVANYTTIRSGSTKVQCGELANDYVSDVTGGQLSARAGDTLDSKYAMIGKIGESKVPVVGGIFVSNPLKNSVGHMGIVSKVNPDGSIEVREANKEGKKEGGVPEVSTYSPSQVSKMRFSSNPASQVNGKAVERGYVNQMVIAGGGFGKISKEELALINKNVKDYISQGLSPSQALLKYKGFTLRNPEDTDKAYSFLDIGNNISEKIKPSNYESKVSELINRGDYKSLADYANGLVDKEVKSRNKDAILSPDFYSAKNAVSGLVSLIEKNKDALGKVAGNVEKTKKLFASNPEFQKMQTILEKIQADERKYFAGSAVTATEMEALKNFIGGNVTDNPDNLITQLKTLHSLNEDEFLRNRQGLEVPGFVSDYEVPKSSLSGQGAARTGVLGRLDAIRSGKK